MSITNKPKPIEYFPADFSINTWDDIPKAVNFTSSIKSIVDTNLKGYETINVSEAMKQLATVGDLLKLANAAANEAPVSVKIIAILSRYGTLVTKTDQTTSLFVRYSIEAIKQHALALRVAERKPEKALVLLARTAEQAKEMARLARELSLFAKELVDMSTEALIMATENKLEKVEAEKKNEEARNALEAKGAELRSEIEGLNSQVAELKELATTAATQAASERKTANILRIVSAIMTPIAQVAGAAISAKTGGSLGGGGGGGSDKKQKKKSGGRSSATEKVKERKKKINEQVDEKKKELEEKKEEKSKLDAIDEPTDEQKEKKKHLAKAITELQDGIKSLGESLATITNEIADDYKAAAAASADKETEYLKLKLEYQNMARKSNSELAGSLVKLKSLSDEKNYLELSIKSLELTITTMGRVKVIFEKTQMFWENVEMQCLELANQKNMALMADMAQDDEDFKVDFINEIKKSGLNWLALANINRIAANSISTVKKNFDVIFSNLPGKAEAANIVKTATGEIQLILEEDNKKIDQHLNETNNQIALLSRPISAEA